MIRKRLCLLVIGCFIFLGCPNAIDPDWNVLFEDGGSGKDGIPSIDNPNFVSVSEVDFLSDNDLVIGYVVNNQAKAYPHRILDWHEIVNDTAGGKKIVISYSPLTGTAVCWSRNISLGETTFGTSGLLHNSNLILYDRRTGSNWSQFRLECVNGELRHETPTIFTIIETKWKTWKAMYPTSQVLSEETGVDRNYDVYPYGDYKTSNVLNFEVNPTNDGLANNKERVHGVLGESGGNKIAKVYRFKDFNTGVKTIHETFGGKDYVVVGDSVRNFMVSFERVISGTVLNFLPIQGEDTVIMTDNEGNQWNIFGEAITGPRTGQHLTPTTSFMGYWFAWAAFYTNPSIYNE